MAYSIIDGTQKCIGPGPSINGLRQLKKVFADNEPKNLPALDALLQNGYTTKLTRLVMDCRTLAKRTDDANVKSSLTNLQRLASKAEDILILEV